jgi:DNA primase large subunit
MAADLKTLAKYPFLPAAKEYVASLSLTLDQIRAHPIYSAAYDLGTKRVQEALRGEVPAVPQDKVGQELAVLSYVLARIVVNAAGNKNLIARYAKAEAYGAYELLRKESDEVVEYIRAEMNLPLSGEWMMFSDYLRLTKDMSTEGGWKLASRAMDSGRVKVVSRSEVLALLRELIREKIAEPVETRHIPAELKTLAKALNESVSGTSIKVDFKELRVEALPPCIIKMTASMEAGSASHNHMFILATFFFGLGMKEDDVVKIFSKSPKFNEEKTRYQLSFLSGTASTTKYSCPTCAKIKSYGLCVAECGVKHPLHYYRDKARAVRRK